MNMYTFGFIGSGNMGGALAKAACMKLDPATVVIANRHMEKSEALAKILGCKTAPDGAAVAKNSRYIFLGVKPQMMEGMLSKIAPVLKERQDRFLLVTMAAGLTMERIAEMAGGDYPIIRIMPNTAAAVGEGVILYTHNENVTKQEMDFFVNSMAAGGMLDEIDEHLIDAGCAVTGCGPAFCDMFIEAMADAGVACGLTRGKALQYAAQMMIGTSKLMLMSGKHPEELKDSVCSPAGSTIQGVRALEKGGFRSAVFEAVTAAYEKTVDLGK